MGSVGLKSPCKVDGMVVKIGAHVANVLLCLNRILCWHIQLRRLDY